MRRHENLDSVRDFYNRVSRHLDSTDFGAHSRFQNYGYLSIGDARSSIRLPHDALNESCCRLVLELVAGVDLSGKDVLDVGCGRGGTLDLIGRYYETGMLIGVDIAAWALRFCEKSAARSDMCFLLADAHALPFADSSLDVILNVESSHSYRDLLTFYREAARVLKKGGRLLMTDVFHADEVEHGLRALGEMGFHVDVERDITPNVVGSYELLASRVGRFGRSSEFMASLLPSDGAGIYGDLLTGRSVYRICQMSLA